MCKGNRKGNGVVGKKKKKKKQSRAASEFEIHPRCATWLPLDHEICIKYTENHFV